MMPTPDTFLYDAFLSYRNCEPDRGFAWNLLVRLESAGLKVAIDRRDFKPAATFLEEMERCVRESRFTLAVLSPRYFESGNTWEEAILCKVLDMGERRRRLIPLLLEPVERPVWLYDIVGVDFSGPQTLVDPHARLLAALGASQRVQAADEGPEPRYADATTHALAKAMEESLRREQELLSRGADATAVRREILELRRQLREGGRLQAGDFLVDGRFQLVEPLGRGGFATVWKAFDRREREVVALKVLHGQFAEDRSRRERFFRGAREMEELHHPGIVRVTEKHLVDGGYHLYAMEYLKGGDLREAVLGKRLAPEALLPLLQEVAAALSFAHENGVIHRDVKPANILLDAEGHAKLTDFDLVRAANSTGGTLEGGMLGTFLYSAPETMSAPQDAGVAADVYSLGMTVAFCLYGADLPLEVLQEPGTFLRALPCSAGLQEVLRRAIALRPEGRFGSVAELSRALAEGVTSPAPVVFVKTDTERQVFRLPAVQGLVMGFGGTGARILAALKEQMVREHGRVPDSVRFLLFDTIADWEPAPAVEGGSLDPKRDYFCLSDHDPDLAEHLFELLAPGGVPENLPHLEKWLNAAWLRLHLPLPAIGIAEGTGQQRQLGRFALFQNAERILLQINKEIRYLRERSASVVVQLWVIGSAAGGTGAGCFVDAAFLARRAEDNLPISIAGVVVLPEVYMGQGINKGRAYSLLRELDRFQEQGCSAPDRFVDGKMISSRVRYDSRGRLTSDIGSRLFDNLFYVGESCATEAERTSFFTAVATSIDLFLDNETGPTLLQNAVNSYAAASAFGAARLYIPVEIYADIFAWEEVERYLEGVAPYQEEGQGLALRYGSAEDRAADGVASVRGLLPLFRELSLLREDQFHNFARRLSPSVIVKEWCGFGGTAVAGFSPSLFDLQAARITYVNPYISWTEEDPERVPDVERTLKTFQENKSAKGPREEKIQSRDRFAGELERITVSYCRKEAGDQSFERGRRLVTAKLSSFLRSRVDELVENAIQQKPEVGPEPGTAGLGTVMNRLFKSFQVSLADGGALQRIEATVSQLAALAQSETVVRQVEAVRAARDLREFTPSFFRSVEEPQQATREASAEYIAAYQKFRLLQDMQGLVREVRERFAEWTALMKRMFDGLVLAGEYSGLAETRKELRHLGGRLGRLAENRRALISCIDSSPPDLTMHGFREILRQGCVRGDGSTSLAESALSGSVWQATQDFEGRPQIHLVVHSEEGEQRYGTDTVAILHRALHDWFRQTIDARMDQYDIFDYLRHVQGPPHNVDTEAIAQRLMTAAKVLIGAPEADFCSLIYPEPVPPDKRVLARRISSTISGRPGNQGCAELHHSDKFSLALFKIRKPRLAAIHSIRQSRKEYLEWQQASLSGRPEHDDALYRAQVYHPFRPEVEAWYIERRHALLSNSRLGPADHIPPRLVRLLEDPAMMQAFVHCIATGAVEAVAGAWIWHDTANGRDVVLTERGEEAATDLVRAAVVFVLQQREGRREGLIPIRVNDARQSALDAAQAKGHSCDDLIREFIAVRLDAYLDSHFRQFDDEVTHQRERNSLRMLFEFYAHPETGTELSERLAL